MRASSDDAPRLSSPRRRAVARRFDGSLKIQSIASSAASFTPMTEV
jgi:hypothetical protein